LKGAKDEQYLHEGDLGNSPRMFDRFDGFLVRAEYAKGKAVKRSTVLDHRLFLSIYLLLIMAWQGVCGCASSSRVNGLVAVLTDFGTTGFYVGAMQGAMYTANPRVRIATITHEIEPFNVSQGSYLLAQAAREFPTGTVFLCIVDPGVGTERRGIVLESADGKLFVAPDNGLLTGVMDVLGVSRVHEITEGAARAEKKASSTFHGRDIYGPVAAQLAGGAKVSKVGRQITDPVRLSAARAHRDGTVLVGTVIHVDRYGNLITNIEGNLAHEAGLVPGKKVHVTVGSRSIIATFSTTYGDVPEGNWLALINAEGVVEVARNMGNAAQSVGALAGAVVRLKY
jgi:hypothetical protein